MFLYSRIIYNSNNIMEYNKHYTGLNEEQVRLSRKQYGANVLTPPKKQSIWKQFLEKFNDPIIKILLATLVLSVGISFYHFFHDGEGMDVFFEPFGIFVAILLATTISFIFEVKANKAFNILNKVNDSESVQVIRDSRVQEIPKKDVVVGDIVLINTGAEIPADGELLEATALQINESTLTGEPMIKKTTDPAMFDKDATYPSNQVMRGTTVIEGHGIFRVMKVGDATENGKVYQAAQIDNSVKTPLNIQLERLSKIITIISYVLASLIIVGRLVSYFHSNDTVVWVDFSGYLLNTVMIAVTLIVVSVPEGLPMSVTLSLAMSMKRMLKANNLVRKMHACETMGATTVICTDKTGTLTKNQMQVYDTRFIGLEGQQLKDNEGSIIITEGIATNSTAHLDKSNPDHIKVIGNPTEGALILWLQKNGIDYLKIRENTPVDEQLIFSTERKYMATVVRSQSLGKRVLYVKGAPEILLNLCDNIRDGMKREEIEAALAQYQHQAMRTLGFAYKYLDEGETVFKDNKLDVTGLTFIGIVAISDPVRDEVPAAVNDCLHAGINIKIVTGDTPATAREIGRQIGLWTESDGADNEITGPELAALTDEQLLERAQRLKIISRARPMDKSRLVKALQEKGEIVAVTGDGTNDAPALKSAHVGLSMGDGTSVAKEASDITIIDNSFSSIAKAVMWGRSLYQNIQRFILFQMTINVVACMIVLIGAFTGTESPITVTQMLWVNLIMDTFAAMALASLPPSKSVMDDKPRKRTDFIITRAMWAQILIVGFLFVVALVIFLQYIKHADLASLLSFDWETFKASVTNFSYVAHGLSTYEISLFFSLFVFMQFWNMFNAKAYKSKRSALHFSGCKGFILISLVIIIGQIAIVSFGGEMFTVTPLDAHDWIILLAVTSPILFIGEIVRLFKKIFRYFRK